MSDKKKRPRFLVIAAPEIEGLTPDDLVIEPAHTPSEVDTLWGIHDGRNFGTMVVGVYEYRPDSDDYARTTEWGILGDIRKMRQAHPDQDRM